LVGFGGSYTNKVTKRPGIKLPLGLARITMPGS
jgi:hypothetical protein